MRRAIFVLILAVLSIAGPVSARADTAVAENAADITGRWGVGLGLAGAFPNEGDADAGLNWGGNVTYGVNKFLALEIDVSHFSMDYEAINTDFGDLEGTPLIFSLQWRYPFLIGDDPAAIYGLTGIGPIFYSFDENAGVREVEATDAFAVRFGFGWDFFWHRNWAMNLEGSYTLSDTDLTFTNAPATDTATGDTDFFLVGGGVKYYFD